MILKMINGDSYDLTFKGYNSLMSYLKIFKRGFVEVEYSDKGKYRKVTVNTAYIVSIES